MRGPWIALGAAAVVAGAWLAVDAQVRQGRSRPAKTGDLMRGILEPSFNSLDATFKGPPPDRDEAWETARVHASLLSELSYSLMEDGRCPDQVWADSALRLREGAAAMIAAAGRKDVAAARSAVAGMKASCASCHKAHHKSK